MAALTSVTVVPWSWDVSVFVKHTINFTTVTAVPVHLDLEKPVVGKIDWQGGAKYMREKLGFKSIPQRIEKKPSEQLGLI